MQSFYFFSKLSRYAKTRTELPGEPGQPKALTVYTLIIVSRVVAHQIKEDPRREPRWHCAIGVLA